MMSFILDTNVFNHLVEGKINMEELPLEFPILITHLQRDEINNCPDPVKKSYLQSWLRVLPDMEVPTETMVWDVSQFDKAKWGDGEIYTKILDQLNARKKRKNNANINDALIGEVAIKNQFVLVTNDADLGDIVKSLGGFVKDVKSMKSSFR
jgi:predicted nucleic acid-binding protein